VKGIETCFDGDEAAARAYFEAARHELRHGDPDNVLDGLQPPWPCRTFRRRRGSCSPTPTSTSSRTRDHIDYALFKNLGLPIRERPDRKRRQMLIQQRFKCVGHCGGASQDLITFLNYGSPGQ